MARRSAGLSPAGTLAYRRGMFAAVALISLAAAPTFTEQVLQAQAIVELTVELAPGTPRAEEAALLGSLKRARTVSRVLVAPEGAPAVWPVPAMRAWRPDCPGTTGRLTLLALYTADAAGKWRGLALDQQAQGRGTDRDVAYNLLVEAVAEARQWHEERMRAVGPQLLWQRQRAALHNENPFLRALAVAFLAGHGAADVVDAEWGASGTEGRRAEEARAVLPKPRCAAAGK